MVICTVLGLSPVPFGRIRIAIEEDALSGDTERNTHPQDIFIQISHFLCSFSNGHHNTGIYPCICSDADGRRDSDTEVYGCEYTGSSCFFAGSTVFVATIATV